MKSVDPFITGFIEITITLDAQLTCWSLRTARGSPQVRSPPPILVRATRLAHLSSDHPGDVGDPYTASQLRPPWRSLLRSDVSRRFSEWRHGWVGERAEPAPLADISQRRSVSHLSTQLGVLCVVWSSVRFKRVSVSRTMLRVDVFLRETLSLCSVSSLLSKYA